MENDRIVDYIRKELSAGISKELIRQNARKAGWPDINLDQAFAEIERSPAANVTEFIRESKQTATTKTNPIMLASVLVGLFFVTGATMYVSLFAKTWMHSNSEADSLPQKETAPIAAQVSDSTLTPAQVTTQNITPQESPTSSSDLAKVPTTTSKSSAPQPAKPRPIQSSSKISATSSNPHQLITPQSIPKGARIVQGEENPAVQIKTGNPYPPAGFLVPTDKSIPSEYVKFIQTATDDGYSMQNNAGIDRYSIYELTETPTTTCASRATLDQKYYKEKAVTTPFTFQNLSGSVVTITEGNSVMIKLFLSDSGRCLNITNSTHATPPTPDDLIASLSTFIRQPEWKQEWARTHPAPSPAEIVIPVTRYSSYLGLAKQIAPPPPTTPYDKTLAIVGFEWQYLPENPSITDLMLPTWQTDGFKSTAPSEVSYWDGTSYRVLGQFKSGEDIKFPEGGVRRFKVTGIDPSVRICANESAAYIWAIQTATSGPFSAVSTPITQSLPAGTFCNPTY